MPPAEDAAAEVCPDDEPHADLPSLGSNMEIGESDGEDEVGQDADADASSPILVDSASDDDEAEADAAAAPAEAAAPDPAAAASLNNLLPPVIPPCSASEVCPRGCEDPQQPGSDCRQRQAAQGRGLDGWLTSHVLRLLTARPCNCSLAM